ncbi:multicomponent Na+:H+ antiporter subunit G [Natronospira proteinivora]|uniref:Multicomponent Na+:H+ antiporter subunit G n=1 Tax=Natronospira proteinivora TaxID=1807133 RepID=A0ABT1G7K9_9GAMM|nr:monovalent cation/H(+) antiporter subunit G [Natronospira proteinivora]MCP1727062.1 multicomponent Na+:H+ antiporter subunit G [Natronospira proteinivora]
MELFINLISGTMLAVGSLLLLIGGVGLIRFPDFYSRIQAAGITDSLCSILILVGLMLQADTIPVAAKLLFTLLFLLFTAPTASHALAKAARHSKLDPWQPGKGGASSKR